MRKGDVKDIESLDEYYSKGRKIRFADDVQINSMEDIYNNLFSTVARSKEGQQPTYFIKGTLQCDQNRHRSIDDFIKLCKRYFPDKSLKDIFVFLKEKQDSLEKDGLRQALSYCPNIRKYNFKGLVNVNYARGIEDYYLRDLNPNLQALKVSDLLT